MASIQPYVGKLGNRLAKHLLRRATFGINKSLINEFSDYTVDQALSKLLDIPDKKLTQPIHYVNGGLTSPSPWINDDPVYGPVNDNNDSGQVKRNNYLAGWWLDEAKDDLSLRHKMTYFLFTDFTTSIRTLNNEFHYDYLMLLEFFCLGDWKEFCFQMTKNNVMLSYLNNDENTKANPNENFAREVLELFTIGKGAQAGVGDYTNYTESDVEEAARVLTGWTFDKRNRGLYVNGETYGNIPCGYAISARHDFGEKQFSHRFNNFKIDAWDTSGKSEAQKQQQIEAELRLFFDMVLSQEETAKFICRKLYRFFVSRTIDSEIENDIIAPLSETFRSNYNLAEAISQLLRSKHFYDADDGDSTNEIIGGMIKTPMDLVLQTLSITNYPVPDAIERGEAHYKNFYYFQIMNKILVASGQDIFRPPSVAGFPPFYEAPDYDKFWFNSSTIIARYNMASVLLNSGQTKADFYVSDFIKEQISNPFDAFEMVRELTDIMFPESVSEDRLSYFVNDILLDDGTLTPEMWFQEWTDFNSSGSRSGVESALVPLFNALTWSQEYQTN